MFGFKDIPALIFWLLLVGMVLRYGSQANALFQTGVSGTTTLVTTLRQ